MSGGVDYSELGILIMFGVVVDQGSECNNFNSRLNQAEIANLDIHEKQMNRGSWHCGHSLIHRDFQREKKLVKSSSSY